MKNQQELDIPVPVNKSLFTAYTGKDFVDNELRPT